MFNRISISKQKANTSSFQTTAQLVFAMFVNQGDTGAAFKMFAVDTFNCNTSRLPHFSLSGPPKFISDY